MVPSGSILPSNFTFNSDSYLVTQGGGNFPFISQQGLVVALNNENLIAAINYFYKKATLEIKHFQHLRNYQNISKNKFGILYYTGRILPSQEFDGKLNLSDVCIDLTKSTFCVPLVEKYSPIAYAIINEVHWYDEDVKHSGNETVLRSVQKIAYILEGRSLVKTFRKQCPRCKLLNKKEMARNGSP